MRWCKACATLFLSFVGDPPLPIDSKGHAVEPYDPDKPDKTLASRVADQVEEFLNRAGRQRELQLFKDGKGEI